jgi:hypothetical protein
MVRGHAAREVVVNLLREIGVELAGALLVPVAAAEEASDAQGAS